MVVTLAVALFYPSHFLTFSVKSDHVVKRALEVIFMLLAIGAVIYGYVITGSPILGLFTMSFGAIVFVAFILSYLLPRIPSKSSQEDSLMNPLYARKQAVSRITLTLLLIGMLTLTFNIQQARGGARSDGAHCVVETGNGGYALAGVTQTFGAGSGDFWLVRTDSSGNREWDKTYGGKDWEAALCVVETSDGGYVLAGTTDPEEALPSAKALLVKVDSSGDTQWSKTYGDGTGDCASCVAESSDGGYVLVGYGAMQSYWRGNSWLVKTDSAGNMEWNRTYGEPGHYAVVYSVVETGDGGYALAGCTESFGVGKEDFWLIKTDVGGNMEWNRTYGGANADEAFSFVQTSDGGYALAGVTRSFGAGTGDFWLVKTDSYGNHQWNRTYGGADWDAASSVVEAGGGGYVLAGGTSSFGAGSEDSWLVKTDSSGNKEWDRTYGGDDLDDAGCVAESSDGGYVLAGGTWSFGADEQDFWLVKVDAAGNMEWSKMFGGTYYGLPVLYIGLASAILIVAVAVTIAYVRRKKHPHKQLNT